MFRRAEKSKKVILYRKKVIFLTYLFSTTSYGSGPKSKSCITFDAVSNNTKNAHVCCHPANFSPRPHPAKTWGYCIQAQLSKKGPRFSHFQVCCTVLVAL